MVIPSGIDGSAEVRNVGRRKRRQGAGVESEPHNVDHVRDQGHVEELIDCYHDKGFQNE